MVSSVLVAVLAVFFVFSSGSKHAERSDDYGSLEAMMAQQAQELSTLRAELTAAKDKMTAMETQLSQLQVSHGSTFIRWGRSVCPNTTQLLYSGVVGGSPFQDTGGAPNRLCLTMEPVFDGTPFTSEAFGRLAGAEYYLTGRHFTDVVCAVCHTHLSSTFMVPGTNRCPGGSLAQYTGYLTSTKYQNPASAQFLCLDAQPEDRAGSQDEKYGAYFEHAVTTCGSLPCPPYVDNKVATCVVCSM